MARMLGGNHIRAGIAAGALTVFLTACTQPAFLSLPQGDEPLTTRTATPPVVPPTDVTREAAVVPAARPTVAAPVDQPPIDRDLWRTIGNALTLQPPPRHRSPDPLKHFGHSRRYIATATARAKPYLSHVWGEVQKRNLPAEITLIPLIESSYNNGAGNLRGPAGLWQFIPATGTRFGLRLSDAYDGRKDVIAGTRAALDYLELLGKRFDGDWLLAIAAYNCGERTVEQAIARNRKRARPTDFWSLDLPSGTRQYIPRLLDLSLIVQRPGAYGVTVAVISSEPYFETLDVGGGIDLRRVARKSGLYPNEFEALNAAYRHRRTIANGPTTVLVARGFGTGVQDLLATLPAAPDTRLAATDAAGTAAGGASTIHSGNASVHVVVPGDNLWDVARRHGMSSRTLASANGIAVSSTLRPGQRLHVPSARTEPAAVNPSVVTHYKVRSGDSLWTIARRFKVSVNKLKLWNRHAAARLLQPGERLIVQQSALPDDRQKI